MFNLTFKLNIAIPEKSRAFEQIPFKQSILTNKGFCIKSNCWALMLYCNVFFNSFISCSFSSISFWTILLMESSPFVTVLIKSGLFSYRLSVSLSSSCNAGLFFSLRWRYLKSFARWISSFWAVLYQPQHTRQRMIKSTAVTRMILGMWCWCFTLFSVGCFSNATPVTRFADNSSICLIGNFIAIMATLMSVSCFFISRSSGEALWIVPNFFSIVEICSACFCILFVIHISFDRLDGYFQKKTTTQLIICQYNSTKRKTIKVKASWYN